MSSNFQTVELIRRSLRMAEMQLEKRDFAECRKHLDIAGNTLKELEPKNDKYTDDRKRKRKNS